MTFRDTSADTTLDNANMGTGEDFEKWAQPRDIWIGKKISGEYFNRATTNALLAYEAGHEHRQPEIDALKEKNAIMENDFFRHDIRIKGLSQENVALKAENERLRDALGRLLAGTAKGNADTHEQDCMCVYHEAQKAMKDFSTTTKEEWGRKDS